MSKKKGLVGWQYSLVVTPSDYEQWVTSVYSTDSYVNRDKKRENHDMTMIVVCPFEELKFLCTKISINIFFSQLGIKWIAGYKTLRAFPRTSTFLANFVNLTTSPQHRTALRDSQWCAQRYKQPYVVLTTSNMGGRRFAKIMGFQRQFCFQRWTWQNNQRQHSLLQKHPKKQQHKETMDRVKENADCVKILNYKKMSSI